MRSNLGKLDRLLRFNVALILIASCGLGFLAGQWALIALVIAIILLLTSVIGICPMYAAFGLNSRSPMN